MIKRAIPARNDKWWIQNLLDRHFVFEVFLLGLPGRIRIPARWEVRQEPQKEHLFYFVAEGGFRARIEKKDHEFAVGDFIWIPAGNRFHFWLPPGKELVIHRFRLKVVSKRSREDSVFPARILPKAWPCLNWMEQIIAEAHFGNPGRSSKNSGKKQSGPTNIRLRGLLLCLFDELQRLERSTDESSPGLNRQQQQELILFTNRNTGKWLRPADLSAHLQLSHDYFSRLFARSFGKAPRRWLVEQRIHQAGVRLTESSLNISQIAEEFGYQDIFLFSRQFKMITGSSPLQFRKRGSFS